MTRGLTTYLLAPFLALVLTVTGFSLAQARGGNPGAGQGLEMVICTGIGMTTVTIGPDGEPIETQYVCPDGGQIFTTAFALPSLDRPEARLIAVLATPDTTSVTQRPALTPAARGPPSLI